MVRAGQEASLGDFEKSLRCLGLYHGDKQSAKVSQAPNLADIEATDTRSPWHKNRSVLDSSVPSKADRAIKFNEISQYEDEKVGFSAPLGKATISRASGGSTMKGSTIFGPTFTLPFSDTDLIADIQNYLGYLRARIAATYTLVMREKRDIARMQSQEHFLQSDDDTGSEAETEPETEQTFVEKRMPLRSFLEIDSGILDEVCEVMVTEVAYEVEYSMADAFIILPLMNIIHEVAVDGLMEMTPDPEQLHKEC